MSARDLPRRRQLLIQIDGLSRPALERAAEQGAAPALWRYANDPRAQLLSVYSGLPSTTPAAQGELFYSVRCAVPAFAYLHARSEARHMLDPSAADEVQRRIEAEHEGLLEGGASYCNIYTGGAEITRFCPAAVARPGRALSRGPVFTLRSLVGHAGVAFRSAGMLAGEAARLLSRRVHDPSTPIRTRLGQSWERILFSVALRDNARLAALHDLKQNRPVVHLNLLGYDVQSHRYGPDSPQAHRALKGIDRAIASLLREIRALEDPDATAVVYSDHGQEHTKPLRAVVGAPIEEIVRDASSAVPAKPGDGNTPRSGARRSVTNRGGEKMLGVGTSIGSDARGRFLATVGSGPIAHLYLDDSFDEDDIIRVARRVCERAPGVAAMVRREERSALALIGCSEPSELARFCEQRLVEHPFRAQIAPDLDRLVRHPDAGDIVLLTAGFTDSPVTFADERGSHGGPGPLETHAFIIAPRRLRLEQRNENGPLRLSTIRRALLEDRAGTREP